MIRLFFSALIFVMFSCSQIQAQTCENGAQVIAQSLSLSNLNSWDGFGDSDNYTTKLCGFLPNSEIIGSVYSNIDLSPFGQSWCSEVSIRLGQVTFTPAAGENNTAPCNNNYTGGGAEIFTNLGISFEADGMGCVDIQIYESFDDEADEIDATILSGDITLFGCPEVSAFLPIELSEFFANSLEEKNLIQWETASERNSEWHVIERSDNGRENWIEIGRVQAHGNSDSPTRYELNDEKPLPVSYYRIKEISFDGTLQYSEVILVKREIDGLSILSVFPQPADDYLEIKFQAPNAEEYNFYLLDILGRELSKETIFFEEGINNYKLNTQNISSGNYLLLLKNEQGLNTKKILIE